MNVHATNTTLEMESLAIPSILACIQKCTAVRIMRSARKQPLAFTSVTASRVTAATERNVLQSTNVALLMVGVTRMQHAMLLAPVSVSASASRVTAALVTRLELALQKTIVPTLMATAMTRVPVKQQVLALTSVPATRAGKVMERWCALPLIVVCQNQMMNYLVMATQLATLRALGNTTANATLVSQAQVLPLQEDALL